MSDRLANTLIGLARSGKPVTIILMRLLMDSDSEHQARMALGDAVTTSCPAEAERLRSVARLWDGHPQAYATIRATLAGLADPQGGLGRIAGVGGWAEAFDRVVDISAEASVAAYSLGDPHVLASATQEVCACMQDWGLLNQHSDALDLGCGIGRFLTALSPHVRSLVGIDVSAGMVAQARRRCAGLANVTVVHGTGLDLQPMADNSLDLVLAADVFPYLVDVGGGLAQAHMGECARVLRAGGHLIILNYAYVGSDPEQSAEVSALASKTGLAVIRPGERPFHLWDATAYLLRQVG